MTHVVYVILNHDSGKAYTGLTKHFDTRISQHRLKKPQLFEGRHTVFKSETMSAEIAQRKEAAAVRYLQLTGYETVNVAKTGSLGQPVARFWTKERCTLEASKYATRGQFQRGSVGAYNAALRHGWLDSICEHMEYAIKPSGFWTKERCANEARRYATRNDFQRRSSGAHEAAYRNKWLGDVCAHMKGPNKPSGYWTNERCADEARKCQTRKELYRRSRGAYDAANRNGWLDDICAHMRRVK